jgi:hypothetical protein
VEGAAFNGPVAVFRDFAGAGTAAAYTASITWGDGGTAPGVVAADSTGGFTVSGAYTYAEEGAYAVTVLTAAAAGPNVSASTTAAVADAPLSGTAGPVSAVEGTPFSGVVADFTDADPAAAASEYTASIAWGDGQTSAGTVAPDGRGGFTVSGAHTYAEEGSYPVSVTLTDAGGASTSASTTAAIADAPLSAAAASVSAVEGTPFSGVVADFTDADPAAAASEYTASIAWGDGQTSAGTVAPDGQGGFTVSGAHTYAEEGSYPVSVTITDAGGASASATDAATVADAPLNATGTRISALATLSFSGVVATFTDAASSAAAADYGVSIGWGDGQNSAGSVAADGRGGFTVSATHTYTADGDYPVSVTITDTGGAVVTADTPAEVTDAAGTPVSAVEGAVFNGPVAVFRDFAGAGTAAAYSASITWGDGGTSAGVVAADGSSGFTVNGSYTYAGEGAYAVTILLSAAGASASASTTAAVADAPLSGTAGPVSAVEGTPFSGVVADFTDANPAAAAADFSAAITWGDGQSSAGAIAADGHGGFTVAGSNTYATQGNYPVTVTITDAGGAGATVTAAVAVADAPLSITDMPPAAAEVTPFSGVVADFTDADPASPNFDLAIADAIYSATIAWGDGQLSAGTVAPDGRGGFTVSGAHTYAEEGGYPVTVTIADAGGASASATATATVADAALSATANAISSVEGTPFRGVVAYFTDADPANTPSDYTATIAWGDGQISTGAVAPDGQGAFTVSGSNTYAEEDSYAVTVTVTDAGGASASAGASASVADAGLRATGTSVTAVEATVFGGVVASFTDTDPAGTAADYTASITWGDGHTSTGMIAPDGQGGFTVSGTNTYAEQGPYGTAVTIADAGGAAISVTASATVADAPLLGTAMVLTPFTGMAFSGPVARFTDADPDAAAGDYTVTVVWGDGKTSAGTVTANGAGGFTVSGSHTYAADGVFSVAVTVSTANDPGSSPATISSTADVGGPATALKVTSATTVNAGTPFSLTVKAVDARGNPAYTYAGTVQFASTDPQAVLPANYRFAPGDLGAHVFPVILKTVGGASPQSVTVTDTGTASMTAHQGGIQVIPGAAVRFKMVTSVSSLTAGGAFTVTVTALDAYGNKATGYRGAVRLTSSDGQAVLPPTYTFTGTDNGAHVFSVTLKTVGSQTVTATDTANSAVAGTTAPITVSAGAATRFLVSAPASVTHGVAFNFTVTALDAFGNVATSYLGTVHSTSTDTQAILPANFTFTAANGGVATFTAILKTTGTKSLTVTDTVKTTLKGTDAAIRVL